MNNEYADRRVRKTRKLLLDGLTQLMQKKSVKDITVHELSDLVDINRGTFYLHYRDIDDMVDKVENELFTEFTQVLNKFTPQDLKIRPLPVLTDLFTFLANNAAISLALLGKNGDIVFIDKLKAMVKDKCLHNWMEIYKSVKTRNYEYYYSYLIYGFIGLIQNWLENNMTESPEYMAGLAEKMVVNGIKVLEEQT